MTSYSKKWKYRFEKALPWILAALAILTGHCAAVSLHDCVSHYLPSWFTDGPLITISFVLLFVVVAILVYKNRKAFYHPYTRSIQGDAPEQKQHLILFLSELLKHELESDQYHDGVPEFYEITGSLDCDIIKLGKKKCDDPNNPKLKWKWEMPLRAIRHHVPKLQTITVVCSEESLSQVSWFTQMLEKYREHDLKSIDLQLLVRTKAGHDILPLNVDPNENVQGFSFERFDDLSNGIIWLLGRLTRKGKVRENDIIIDFTGGQKVTSVVAAAVTFNRDIEAQYVQTDRPWEVVSYDIRLGSSVTHGFEL